jgi:methionyl-tRNA formyltransferase
MKIVFIGSGDIGIPVLEWLASAPGVDLAGVVTQPDRPAGRGLQLTACAIKEKALSRGLVPLQPSRIRAPEAIGEIALLRPDLLVVMAYGQILPQELLDVPKLGALNLHASLLPRHRGAAPVHAALLAGDQESGITVMWMDAGLDTGDILLQSAISIAPDETAGTLHDRLALLAPAALEEAVRLVREGHPPRLKQDGASATYAPKLDRQAGRIEWSAAAEEIARRVRAFHPWPGSSADLELADGRVLPVKVRRAEALSGSAAAGDILPGFHVGCGGGGLLGIAEIQAPGGRAMSGEDFQRGHRAVRFRASVPPVR